MSNLNANIFEMHQSSCCTYKNISFWKIFKILENFFCWEKWTFWYKLHIFIGETIFQNMESSSPSISFPLVFIYIYFCTHTFLKSTLKFTVVSDLKSIEALQSIQIENCLFSTSMNMFCERSVKNMFGIPFVWM